MKANDVVWKRTNPALYILVRTDMDSLTPGKAMAQAAHAANKFQTEIQKYFKQIGSKECKSNSHWRTYQDWIGESNDGFGTTIVLMVPDEMTILEVVNMYPYCTAGIVHDSTYPIRDGRVTHLIPVNTCGYVFVDRDTLTENDTLKYLPLHSLQYDKFCDVPQGCKS